MRAVVGVLVVALIGPGMRRIENHPRVWMATAGVILEHRYGPKAGSARDAQVDRREGAQ